MTRKNFVYFFLVSLIISIIACKKTEPANSETPQDSALPPDAAFVKTSTKSSSDKCVGPFATGTKQTLKIGEIEYEINGYRMTQLTKDADESTIIGVMSDIKEDTPQNLDNVKQVIEQFKQNKVNLVLVAGDSGESVASIENVLMPLAQLPVPVLVIIGNREKVPHFNTALSNINKKYPNIISMNFVRYFDGDDVDVFSLPGYHDPNFIHSREGCQYFQSDVEELSKHIPLANSPVVLLTHGPALQKGNTAIDRMAEGVNVGDPMLTKLIADTKIPFGVSGNIHEAGGIGTDLSGTYIVKQNTPSDQLFLNPGPTDSVRWQMNDGTESIGMSAILTVEGKKAKYSIFRIKEKP